MSVYIGLFNHLSVILRSVVLSPCLTSPPVLLRDELPGKLLVEVLPSFHDVRLVDKFLPPAILQHHLQLCEIILALKSTLIK